MKYKAIITDVDGTLIQQSLEKGLPTHKVRSAIQKAQEKVHIGIATGRSPLSVSYLLDHVHLPGPSIVLNGAMIIDLAKNNILFADEIIMHDFEKVLKIVTGMNLSFVIDEVGHYVIPFSESYKPLKPLVIFISNLHVKEVEEITTALAPMNRIMAVRVPDWTNKEKWALHISHINASKQFAVLRIAELLHIHPSEIIGIGDSYNDIPLLEACGLKVAMGNAVRDLKAIADYVAPSVDEDGLADIIEKFVLNP